MVMDTNGNSPERDDTNTGEEKSSLDRGLAAAFGGRDSAGFSIGPALAVLERETGVHSRIMLRDEPDATPPMVNTASDEVKCAAPGEKYQLLGEIARGGMGVVLKGRDTDLGRDVAVKILNQTHIENKAILQRFIEEAQIAGQLQHPGILPVYELGVRDDRRPFFTMKLVKGRTLASMLDDRRDPSDDRQRFLSIFEQVCQTIGYAHSRGVIHRDLKPLNVMVGAFGEVQVVDWGLSKVLAQTKPSNETLQDQTRHEETVIQTVRTDSDGSQSLAGSVMGTPAYMAPEQARGDINDLDERTDVFALGCMLCELLAGRPPFEGDHKTMMQQAASGDVTLALHRLEASDVDRELIQLTRQALAPVQKDRPRNAKALADAIGAHRTSVEQRARESEVAAVKAAEKAAHERKARRLTLGLAALFILLIVVVTGGWMWTDSQRDTRIQRETQHALDLLNETGVLYGQATAGSTLLPDEWNAIEPRRDQLVQLLESADIDPPTRKRIESMVATLDRAFEDRKLLQQLFDLIIRHATHDDPTSWTTMEVQTRQVFLDAGIDLLNAPKEDIVSRLKDSELTAHLVNALELWVATAFQNQMMGDIPFTMEQLWKNVEALFEADPDPFRTTLREQLFAETPDAEALHALADSADFMKVEPLTLSWLASAFYRVNDFQAVYDIYQQALLEHPDDTMLNFDYAYMLVAQQRWRDSIPYYMRAIALSPESGGLWRSAGRAYRHVDEFQTAVGLLTRSINLEPDVAATYVDRAIAYRAMQQDTRADDDLRQALKIDPHMPQQYANMGHTLKAQGMYELAARAFDWARELDSVADDVDMPELNSLIKECNELFEKIGNKPTTEYPPGGPFEDQ